MSDHPMDKKRRGFIQAAALTGAGLALPTFLLGGSEAMAQQTIPDMILHNGRITTLDRRKPEVSAIAMAQGRILAIGDDHDILKLADTRTRIIGLHKRRVVPGLNDSHTHLIRGGLNYNLELRWEGVPSLSIALEMLREQAANTPAPQWVRVVGGWSEFQFAERRLPTLKEINQAAPDTPVFILHLYGRALLNQAALQVLGIDRNTPNPPGGVIERDGQGDATGLLLAKPSALILYSTLAQGPKLPYEYQLNSTRHYLREMNRLGITSVIDAGGGGQNYPDDYKVIQELHDKDQLSVRVAYNLFAQKPGAELQSFKDWAKFVTPGQGDAMLRMNGAGENLTWSAADFENFLEPRPDLAPMAESELQDIVRFLVEHRWPFRIHATYDETIERFLNVFELVDKEVPFAGLRFIIDHAETISPRNIERIKALGGGIAIQHRMAFQGEYFVSRYGIDAAKHTPPLRDMLAHELPVGAGTDATRVASYNPWVALYWLVTGKTLGGLSLYGDDNLLDRKTALYLWTKGSSWFSGEQAQKGALSVGEYADLAVLSADYFAVDTEAIKDIHSVMTVMSGRVVYASDVFSDLDPPLPPPMPDWSPVRKYSGHYHATTARTSAMARQARACSDACGHGCGLHGHHHQIAWATPLPIADNNRQAFWGALGCACFAVQEPRMSQPPSGVLSLWSPFAHRAFAMLWLAMVISNIGTWMNDVGAGWLMTTLATDPLLVALVQAATTAPIFLFALPAGALADIVDRRKLLILVNSLMAVTAGVLAALVAFERMNIGLLLVFTFLLGAGAAFIAPAWQSIVPQLVLRQQLGAAIALNAIGMNVSRAIGPALAGVLIVTLGLATPFALNALSFIVIVAVLVWWRPQATASSALPTERIGEAIVNGLRYTLHSAPLRATLLRAVAFLLFASAYWALLPIIARTLLHGDARLYGVLLGCVGTGAVLGALLLPRLKRRLGADRIVAAGSVGTACVLGIFALITTPYAAAAASLLAGMAWIAVISSLHVSAQAALPDWVRARGLSVFLTVFFGAMALGAILWGKLASEFGINSALLIAACGTLAAIPLTWRAKLGQGEALDLAPSLHWPEPVVILDTPQDRGPVMITIEYQIDTADADTFLRLMRNLAQARRRTGAVQWGILEDAAHPGRYVEYFFEASWLAHLRHHERVAGADRSLQERILALHRGETPPQVRHLLAPRV